MIGCKQTMRSMILALAVVTTACSSNTTVLQDPAGRTMLCNSTDGGLIQALVPRSGYNACMMIAQGAGYVAISGDNAPTGARPPLPVSPPVEVRAAPM